MQNLGMNDIMSLMQQFGMNNMQKYMQAFQQMQTQGVPQDMFKAYQQFRKNLGMQGEVTPEQFQGMQNQMASIPPEQLNQVKTMMNQNKTFNGGF
jgi:hypothetical protein